ncbi:MAG: PDDEXK nuclease domain-containing protein [bacterium]
MKETDIVKKQTQDYEKSLSSILKKVEESKHKAITTVDKLLIELYWFIGETIVSLQEKSKWGDGVVEKLSQDLRMKYPEISGFPIRNLWNMKRFYEIYREEKKLQTLSAEIIGKMQFYLAALDEQIKLPHKNPSIGLILCRSKKDAVVRLTLGKTHKPMKISVYQTKLPDKKLIQQRLERIKLPEKLLAPGDWEGGI